jgi:hypothetical protein
MSAIARTRVSFVSGALRWSATIALLAFFGCANSDELDFDGGGKGR